MKEMEREITLERVKELLKFSKGIDWDYDIVGGYAGSFTSIAHFSQKGEIWLHSYNDKELCIKAFDKNGRPVDARIKMNISSYEAMITQATVNDQKKTLYNEFGEEIVRGKVDLTDDWQQLMSAEIKNYASKIKEELDSQIDFNQNSVLDLDEKRKDLEDLIAQATKKLASVNRKIDRCKTQINAIIYDEDRLEKNTKKGNKDFLLSSILGFEDVLEGKQMSYNDDIFDLEDVEVQEITERDKEMRDIELNNSSDGSLLNATYDEQEIFSL